MLITQPPPALSHSKAFVLDHTLKFESRFHLIAKYFFIVSCVAACVVIIDFFANRKIIKKNKPSVEKNKLQKPCPKKSLLAARGFSSCLTYSICFIVFKSMALCCGYLNRSLQNMK
jgi:hypothetical protein